ncbi:hypothetical protein VTK26DRAFT_6554 [Humicola hyalothermophila]
MSQSADAALKPLLASVLLEEELTRKETLGKKGILRTGCNELDEYVLLGGFERGSVVGLSAEEDEVAMLIGLQTIAHALASASSSTALRRAMIITTLPASVLLPKLRMALVSQLYNNPDNGPQQQLQRRVQEGLERVSIARIFDIDGLWEVFGELEHSAAAASNPPPGVARGTETARGGCDEASRGKTRVQAQPKTEIMDSEDEGSLSPPTSPPHGHLQHSNLAPEDPPVPPLPDIILVTHTSTLLNALFSGHDRQAAHERVTLVSTHLRYLTRSPALGGPLIMLLNSTTFPTSSHSSDDTRGGDAPAKDGDRASRRPEPTLRSIFSSSPPREPGHSGFHPQLHPPGHGFYSARRNKPSFGLVFSQMLDLHLLCTRMPRTRADAAAVVANQGTVVPGVSYTWMVEVVLDELGVYERIGTDEEEPWGPRRSREQRWAAVDVEEGRIVDAVLQ